MLRTPSLMSNNDPNARNAIKNIEKFKTEENQLANSVGAVVASETSIKERRKGFYDNYSSTALGKIN